MFVDETIQFLKVMRDARRIGASVRRQRPNIKKAIMVFKR